MKFIELMKSQATKFTFMNVLVVGMLVGVLGCSVFQKEISDPWKDDPVRKILALTNQQWTAAATNFAIANNCDNPKGDMVKCNKFGEWHKRVRVAHQTARAAYVVNKQADSTINATTGYISVVMGALADCAGLDPDHAAYYGAGQSFLMNVLRRLPQLQKAPDVENPPVLIEDAGEGV